jgi:hypothetical protein
MSRPENRSEAEILAAYTRQREIAIKIEQQFEYYMEKRQGPSWRERLSPEQIEFEYSEFRRSRNAWLRRHRR